MSTEYLMMGEFPDISPRTFLLGQISKSVRKLWDLSTKEMSEGEIELNPIEVATSSVITQSPLSATALAPDTTKPSTESSDLSTPHAPSSSQAYAHSNLLKVSQDVLYSRTKWPWPLKDREYALARRCEVVNEDGAIVLVSKSTENSGFPVQDGAVRADNYWCHAVFFSTQPKVVEERARDSASHVDRPVLRETLERGLKERNALTRTRDGRRVLKMDIAAFPDVIPSVKQEDMATTITTTTDTSEAAKFDEESVRRKALARSRLFSQQQSSQSDTSNEYDHSAADPQDSEVPLPPSVVDMLSKVGEKSVPGAIERLWTVLRGIELSGKH
eukprot:gene27520-34248_t